MFTKKRPRTVQDDTVWSYIQTSKSKIIEIQKPNISSMKQFPQRERSQGAARGNAVNHAYPDHWDNALSLSITGKFTAISSPLNLLSAGPFTQTILVTLANLLEASSSLST